MIGVKRNRLGVNNNGKRENIVAPRPFRGSASRGKEGTLTEKLEEKGKEGGQTGKIREGDKLTRAKAENSTKKEEVEGSYIKKGQRNQYWNLEYGEEINCDDRGAGR